MDYPYLTQRLRLLIPKSTLAYWVKIAKEGKPSDTSKKHTPITQEQMELARLKRENAELKMEKEILKKAAAYFAKESLPGTRS